MKVLGGGKVRKILWVGVCFLCLVGCQKKEAQKQELPQQAVVQSKKPKLNLEDIFLNKFFVTSVVAPTWTASGKSAWWIADGSSEVFEFDAVTEQQRILLTQEDVKTLGGLPDSLWKRSDEKTLILVVDNTLKEWDVEKRSAKDIFVWSEVPEDLKLAPNEQVIAGISKAGLVGVDLFSGEQKILVPQSAGFLAPGSPDWVYREEFGLESAWQFSPDSRRIAFLQMNEEDVGEFPLISYEGSYPAVEWQKYPKTSTANARVTLGVVTLEDQSIRWLKHESESYIPTFSWWNAEHLVVQTLARSQQTLTLSDLNVVTSQSRDIRIDHSATWLDAFQSLRVHPAANALFWLSDRSGFRHLEKMDFTSGEVTQLTTGLWQVTEILGFHPGHNEIFISARRDSILQDRIYAVKTSGEIRSLSSQVGSVTAIFGEKHFVSWSSSLEKATHADVHRLDGTHVLALSVNPMANLNNYQLASTAWVQLPSTDGKMVDALRFLPHDFNPAKKYPVILYVYGGPHFRAVSDRWWGARGLYHHLLAESGYVVFFVEHLGSEGLGRQAQDRSFKQLGWPESEDMLNTIRNLSNLPWVDTRRVGLWGWSFGGYLSALTLARGGDLVKAAIAGAPVTSWSLYDTIYTERYMSRSGDFKKTSVMENLDTQTGRLLLLHGLADDNVHVQNTFQLVDALIAKNKRFEMAIYPGQNHGALGNPKVAYDIHHRMLEFWLRNL